LTHQIVTNESSQFQKTAIDVANDAVLVKEIDTVGHRFKQLMQGK